MKERMLIISICAAMIAAAPIFAQDQAEVRITASHAFAFIKERVPKERFNNWVSDQVDSDPTLTDRQKFVGLRTYLALEEIHKGNPTGMYKEMGAGMKKHIRDMTADALDLEISKLQGRIDEYTVYRDAALNNVIPTPIPEPTPEPTPTPEP